MNSHQRKKLLTKLGRESGQGHRYVKDWTELSQIPESKTHRLEVEPDKGNGWVVSKENPSAYGHYLSTHTFYGSNHKQSTLLLRKFGFNVTLANWDE